MYTLSAKLRQCVWLFAIVWTVADQAPLSMEFSGKNVGMGCHFLFQGIFWTQELNLQCRRHRTGGFDPWVRKVPWRKKWQPTPVFLPENSMDRGAWQPVVHKVAKSQTRLSDWAQHSTIQGHWKTERWSRRRRIPWENKLDSQCALEQHVPGKLLALVRK